MHLKLTVSSIVPGKTVVTPQVVKLYMTPETKTSGDNSAQSSAAVSSGHSYNFYNCNVVITKVRLME